MTRNRNRRKGKPVTLAQPTPVRTAEIATAERIQRAGEGGVEVGASGTMRIVASPLERLYGGGYIGEREYRAGWTLAETAFCARIDPGAPSVDWNAAGGNFGPRNPSMFQSQQIADNRLRYRDYERMFKGIKREITDMAIIEEQSFEQIGLVVFGIRDEREAMIAGRTNTKQALDELARYYGM